MFSSPIREQTRRPLRDITNEVGTPGIITPESSPAKRIKIFHDEVEDTGTNIPIRDPFVCAKQQFRRLYSELGGTYARRAREFEFLESNEIVRQYVSTSKGFLDVDVTPFCMAFSETDNINWIGTEQGNIESWNNCDNLNVFDTAVTDISTCQGSICCVSRGSLAVMDKEKKIRTFYLAPEGGAIKQARYHPENPHLILTSSRGGEIGLHDVRASTVETYLFTNTHDIRTKGRHLQNRKNVSVTSLEWIDNNKVVSGCEANLSLKIWDTRKIYKAATRSGLVAETPLPEGSRDYGITSLVVDRGDNSVWAIGMDSKIRSYSLSEPRAGVINTLTSPFLDVRSFYSKMALLEQPHGSYLVTGGSTGGPLIFPLPNRNVRLQSSPVNLRNGHDFEVTCVSVNQTTGDIYSASDDGVIREWSLSEEIYTALKEQDVRYDELWNHHIGWVGQE